MYRIKFYDKKGELVKQTSLRFHDWNTANLYIKKVLRVKHLTTEIVCARGIPF